ncbi:MAG: toll/interleukin-1 receptor domain-containing protein [Planctomycetaceae bacterium]|nr:toll/interleukin-1 receptor domain-containing protein [Planctomycetaceae bacterium]
MELLDRLDVHQGAETKSIELYRGDLTNMGPDEAVDILIVSAFPNDYLPTRFSLIGALWVKGVSVEDLSCAKAVDLRKTCSCWLSAPLTAKPPGIAFDRILCFEPLVRGDPPEVVGDIFRSLVPFLGPNGMGTTVAMPLVACGDQETPVARMLSPLLEAAVNWMSHGLPLSRLKIVVHSSEKAAEAEVEFAKLKSRYQAPSITTSATPSSNTAAAGLKSRYQAPSIATPPKPSPDFGVFISYARQDWDKVSVIFEGLKDRKGLKVFIDREIEIGAAWQQKLFKALENCRKMIAVYSPAYLESKWCKEEYNISYCRQIESGETIIHPILLYSANLPYYMRMINYVDCREGNVDRLRSFCSELLSAITTASE